MGLSGIELSFSALERLLVQTCVRIIRLDKYLYLVTGHAE